jgi:cyclic pyranopterin monophosphate synthase
VSTFPHLNEQGDAHMVDVTAKTVTQRSATARSRVSLSAEVIERLNAGDMPKGDALAVARIAAISATKKTSDLIPLCHPLAIHGVDVSVELDETGSHITVTVKTRRSNRCRNGSPYGSICWRIDTD